MYSTETIYFCHSALNLLEYANCFEMPHLLHATEFHKDIVWWATAQRTVTYSVTIIGIIPKGKRAGS